MMKWEAIPPGGFDIPPDFFDNITVADVRAARHKHKGEDYFHLFPSPIMPDLRVKYKFNTRCQNFRDFTKIVEHESGL